jgi:uncharacterized lipoprotein YajG
MNRTLLIGGCRRQAMALTVRPPPTSVQVASLICASTVSIFTVAAPG